MNTEPSRTPFPGPQRIRWTAPRLDPLPRLTELTLVTGDGIPGGGDSGGSTVIP